MSDDLEQRAIAFLRENPGSSTAELRDALEIEEGHYAVLRELRRKGEVVRTRPGGKGPYLYYHTENEAVASGNILPLDAD